LAAELAVVGAVSGRDVAHGWDRGSALESGRGRERTLPKNTADKGGGKKNGQAPGQPVAGGSEAQARSAVQIHRVVLVQPTIGNGSRGAVRRCSGRAAVCQR